jgi:Flp pilus assembly protein TadD
MPTRETPTRDGKGEAPDERTCRLCWGEEDEGPLVQPCACRGSQKWIHKHCLEKWRRTSPKEDAAYRCGQCKDEYRDALSLELLRARLQAERADVEGTVFTLNTLASELYVQGKYVDEAEPLHREALEVSRETVGDRHPDTLASVSNLGALLYAKGDLTAAEPLFREVLEARRATLGNRHPDTLVSINNLGQLLKAKGDLAAAEPLLREALEVTRETLGDRHPSTLTSINNLGALLYAKGNLAAAEPLIREALEVQRETVGDRHPDTLVYINNLGGLLLAKGDLAAAESLYREALEGRRETLGNRHPDTLTSINNLCMLLQAKGDLAAAEPLLREVIEGLRATLGSGHPDTLACIAKLRRLIIIRRWPGSTYTYIASCSRRSLYLVSVTLASCSAACFAMICTYIS